MNRRRRAFLLFSLSTAVTVLQQDSVFGLDSNRPVRFLPEERRIIEDYYRPDKKGKHKGLPPGLAKRGGNLPPGLQKRLEPLPVDLDRKLTRLPEHYERVIVERDVILLDRRTNRILDIIENVLGLMTGQ